MKLKLCGTAFLIVLGFALMAISNNRLEMINFGFNIVDMNSFMLGEGSVFVIWGIKEAFTIR